MGNSLDVCCAAPTFKMHTVTDKGPPVVKSVDNDGKMKLDHCGKTKREVPAPALTNAALYDRCTLPGDCHKDEDRSKVANRPAPNKVCIYDDKGLNGESGERSGNPAPTAHQPFPAETGRKAAADIPGAANQIEDMVYQQSDSRPYATNEGDKGTAFSSVPAPSSTVFSAISQQPSSAQPSPRPGIMRSTQQTPRQLMVPPTPLPAASAATSQENAYPLQSSRSSSAQSTPRTYIVNNSGSISSEVSSVSYPDYAMPFGIQATPPPPRFSSSGISPIPHAAGPATYTQFSPSYPVAQPYATAQPYQPYATTAQPYAAQPYAAAGQPYAAVAQPYAAAQPYSPAQPYASAQPYAAGPGQVYTYAPQSHSSPVVRTSWSG
jgi:hypothetical protein